MQRSSVSGRRDSVAKYRIKIYYRTELMDKITGYMRDILDDWKRSGKRLEGCQVFEFETDEPLPPETIGKLKALKEDWMEEVVVEEVPV